MGGAFDFRNNVLFNWQHRTIDGGDGSSRVNVVNNYFKPGPATTTATLRHRICKARSPAGRRTSTRASASGTSPATTSRSDPKITADNWAGGVYFEPEEQAERGRDSASRPRPRRASRNRFPPRSPRSETAEEAYEHVLAHAGASLPRRDPWTSG